MAAQRYQNRCQDCGYIWYPREKDEVCPKCKGSNISYNRGLIRWVLILLLIGGVIGAILGGRILLEKIQAARGGPVAEENGPEKPGVAPESSEKPTPDEDIAPPPENPEEASSEEAAQNSLPPSDALTHQRTWTSREGKTLEARLLRLELVDRRYVGIFEKPDGDTFEYKIGNLSEADVELVKGLVAEQE